jgi:hypothetical protein
MFLKCIGLDVLNRLYHRSVPIDNRPVLSLDVGLKMPNSVSSGYVSRVEAFLRQILSLMLGWRSLAAFSFTTSTTVQIYSMWVNRIAFLRIS